MLAHSLRDLDEEAPVILYLHGLGIAGWSWDTVTADLAEYGALVPDLPGHGASHETPWRSLADTAARVAEVVDTLPAQRPLHITGHSLGAYVGLFLLTLRPERFTTALLSGFHMSSPSHRTLLKLAYVANGLVFRAPPLLRRFASVFGDEAVKTRFIEGAKVIRSSTIRRAGIQVVDFEPPAGLDALTLPITAIAGDGEPEGIRSAPARLAERLPDVHPIVLQGRDHLWPLKEPGLYAETLKAHIASHAGPPVRV